VTVAALYVDPEGVYSGLPDVDLWDEARDARLYNGPWPVVAHPPCTHWSIMGQCRGYKPRPIDIEIFEAALEAVRTFGGVLEHPAETKAWRYFGLPHPPQLGWQTSFNDVGWTCRVDQGWYGHFAYKPTWLYAIGVDLPKLQWGYSAKPRIVGKVSGWDRRKLDRSRTPEPFRDVLLEMARSVQQVAA
jgi:hypothetical protein